MIFLNRGYYYNVYDLGNGRVRKVEKIFYKKIIDAFFFANGNIRNWFLACHNIFKGKKHIQEVYSYIKNNMKPDLLGSPKFLKGINYEQDKVDSVGTRLVRASTEEARKIIDRYIQSIFESWKQGFSDRVYNFSINNGINKNGDIILLDFNEVTFSKAEVLNHIESKRWLSASTYTRLDPLIKKYYRQKMEDWMTKENLELFWSH